MSSPETFFPPEIPEHQRRAYLSMLHLAEATGIRVSLPETVIVVAEDEQIPNKFFLGLIGVQYVDHPHGIAVMTGGVGAEQTILEMERENLDGILEILGNPTRPYPVIIKENLLSGLLPSLDQIEVNHYRFPSSDLTVTDFYVAPNALIYDTDDPNVSGISFPGEQRSSN